MLNFGAKIRPIYIKQERLAMYFRLSFLFKAYCVGKNCQYWCRIQKGGSLFFSNETKCASLLCKKARRKEVWHVKTILIERKQSIIMHYRPYLYFACKSSMTPLLNGHCGWKITQIVSYRKMTKNDSFDMKIQIIG